jgi:hypothetical protein
VTNELDGMVDDRFDEKESKIVKEKRKMIIGSMLAMESEPMLMREVCFLLCWSKQWPQDQMRK